MNRAPTSPEVHLAWHRNALRGVCGDDLPVHGEDPQAGWFKCKMVKGGPWVPARIWLYQPCDEETEDLVGDEILQCEINGKFADVEQAWLRLCHNPITQQEFNFMTADAAWSETYAPHEPKANPRERVDWLLSPIPQFSKDQHQ